VQTTEFTTGLSTTPFRIEQDFAGPVHAAIDTTFDEDRERFVQDLGTFTITEHLAEVNTLDDFDRLLWAEESGIVEEAARSDWDEVNAAVILAGDLSREKPTELLREDGEPLLYDGRINALVGEPESGKSWVAMLAMAQAIHRGHHTLMLDFEDIPESVFGRLLLMGVTEAQIVKYFHYVCPSTPLSPAAQATLFGLLDKHRPRVILFDGVNAAMTLLGLKLNENTDATQFHQIMLKPLTATGGTVIVIDHVPKAQESRGGYAIGAQAKKAMTDGAMIQVEVKETFGVGRFGKLQLSVMKDKPGSVRKIAEKRGRSTDYLASLTIDSRDEGKVVMRLFREENETEKKENGTHTGEQKLMVKMMEISQFMERVDKEGKGVSKNAIESNVPGAAKDIRAALFQLVDRGYVDQGPGPRSVILNKLKRPYAGPEDNGLDFILGTSSTSSEE
jgi:hypothetical protein